MEQVTDGGTHKKSQQSMIQRDKHNQQNDVGLSESEMMQE
jgi:hypothetical protein